MIGEAHLAASTLLSGIRDIVAERPAGAEPPGWCVERGWVEMLERLSDDELVAAERDGLAAHVASLPRAPADLIALAEDVVRITHLPRTGETSVAPDLRRASARKRVQVAAFARLVDSLPSPRPERIVDVGSGHGHLTRHLAHTAGVPSEGWERDPARVAVARALVGAGDVRYVAEDLQARPMLSARDLLVGLHACGVLGDWAVRSAGDVGARVVFIGCCLQKHPGDRAPLVVPHGLTASALTVPHAALGLANTRTGEHGIEADLATRTRARRNRFALAHALRAAGCAVSPGEELRSVNRRRANADLSTLAALAFAARGLAAPSTAALDEAHHAALGDFDRERRWALPRAMLGRLIEVWVALDRGAYLAAQGYDTRVAIAFDAGASPRNVALIACRA